MKPDAYHQVARLLLCARLMLLPSRVPPMPRLMLAKRLVEHALLVCERAEGKQRTGKGNP